MRNISASAALLLVCIALAAAGPALADDHVSVLKQLKRALPAGTYHGVNWQGGRCTVVSDPAFMACGTDCNAPVGLSIVVTNGGVPGTVRYEFDIRTADVQVARTTGQGRYEVFSRPIGSAPRHDVDVRVSTASVSLNYEIDLDERKRAATEPTVFCGKLRK